MNWATDKTQRGFQAYEFLDGYGKMVRLQESSNFDPHIWIFPEITWVDGKPLTGAHLTPGMARDVAKRLIEWASEYDD